VGQAVEKGMPLVTLGSPEPQSPQVSAS